MGVMYGSCNGSTPARSQETVAKVYLPQFLQRRENRRHGSRSLLREGIVVQINTLSFTQHTHTHTQHTHTHTHTIVTKHQQRSLTFRPSFLAKAEARALIPFFPMPFCGMLTSSRDPSFWNTSARAEAPLSSRRLRPTTNTCSCSLPPSLLASS